MLAEIVHAFLRCRTKRLGRSALLATAVLSAVAAERPAGVADVAASSPASERAPNPPLPVTVSPGPYYVGSTVSAMIVVPGSNARPLLDLGPIRDFEAVVFDSGPLPESTHQSGYVFRLNLLPKKPGGLRLPPLAIRGPGGQQVTAPVSITVGEPVPAADMSLTATLSSPRCYVGQPVTLEIAWTFPGRISGIYAVDLRVPLLDRPEIKNRDFFSVPKDFGSPIGLPVGNTRVIGGAFGRTIRLRKIIVPQRAGTLTLPGAALLCSVVRNAPDSRMGFAYAPQYDNQFFADADKADAERLYVRSEPIKLEVLPLPLAGKPVGFSGIVGGFSIDAAVEPSTVREGEPLTLTVRVTGYPYAELLDLPGFAQLPGFRGRFRIPSERGVPTLTDTDHGLEKIFRQSLRPISSGVDKVPAIAIPFFDPVTATYKTATTAALPIVVLPGSAATGFDAILSDGSRLKNLLVPKKLAIGPNFLAAELRRPAVEGWTDASWFWWVALGLPPIMYGLLMAATRRQRCRRIDPKLERARWAQADFLRATQRQRDPAALNRALRTYLGDRLGLGVVTFGAIETALRNRGVPAAHMTMLRDIFQEGDRREFSANASGPVVLTNEAVHSVVNAIEASLGVPRSQPSGLNAFRLAVGLVLVCAAAPFVFAAPSDDALTEADTMFLNGINQRFEDPDGARDFFQKAAAGYEYVLRTGAPAFEAGSLHYNSGAARFFAGDLGGAVYHFRMAEHWLPADARVRSALGYVRTQQPDATAGTRFRQSWSWLWGWRKAMPPASGRVAFVVGWTLFWALVALAAFRPSAKLRRFTAAVLIVAGAIAILLFVESLRFDLRREGVVLASEIVARKGPAAIYEPAFESALHAGAEFRVVRQANDWLEILLPGVSEPCWIPAMSVALLGSELPTPAGAARSE